MSSPGRFAASPPRAGAWRTASRCRPRQCPAARPPRCPPARRARPRRARARRDRPSPGLVVGLGDPVSDILVRLDDADLARRVFAKCGIDEPGGCLPVDTDADIQRLLAACGDEWVDGAGVPTATADENDSYEPSFCPGGSAANVQGHRQPVPGVRRRFRGDGRRRRRRAAVPVAARGAERAARAAGVDDARRRRGFGAVPVARRAGRPGDDAHVPGRVPAMCGRATSPPTRRLRAAPRLPPRRGVHAVPPGAREAGDARGEEVGRARQPGPRVVRGCAQLPRRAD